MSSRIFERNSGLSRVVFIVFIQVWFLVGAEICIARFFIGEWLGSAFFAVGAVSRGRSGRSRLIGGPGGKANFFSTFDLGDAAFVDNDLDRSETQGGDLAFDYFKPGGDFLIGRGRGGGHAVQSGLNELFK
jgi:hypothetical protein